MSSSNKINSLAGLKAVAMLCIFWQHCVLYNTLIPDVASRAVEILFLASGFLEARNHLYNIIATSFRYPHPLI